MAKEKLSAASTQPVDLDDSKQLEDLPLDETESKSTEAKPLDTKETTKSDEKKKLAEGEKEEEEDENPPPKPRRPESPILKLQREMKEAFPSIEEKIIYAVLIASQGQQESAFNALLYLSDPTYKPEIAIAESAPPTLPGRAYGGETDNDERLARELQKQYEQEEKRRRREYRRAHQQGQQDQNQEIPDEFEQIKETFAKGVEDARTTLNGWVSSFARKIDGKRNDEGDEFGESGHGNTGNSPKLFGALGGSSVSGRSQGRQGMNSRFDEDPVILSSGVNLISLHDQDKDDAEAPKLPKRKDSPGSATSSPALGGAASAKPSKWQPLSSDVPVNSDAFLVTDSDDELESKKDKK